METFSFLCKMKNNVIAYIMPSICAYCKKFLSTQAIFCSSCKEKIFPIVSKKIDITSTFSVTVFAISDYKDPLKKLILAKGWSDALASYQMGELLWEYVPLDQLDCDIIVPIPLHWTRYAWRGFNQAEEMAKAISEKSGKPVVHLLQRTKKTKFQNMLSKEERFLNVQSTFKIALSVSDYLQY